MTANELVDALRKEYIEKITRPSEWEELARDVHIEQRDVKGYHGREILELLQNADDAYQKLINSGKKPDCELEIVISYINDVLTISNTGTFFDDEGVKAIVQGNISPKKGGYIGNKGTGFRSILNWAKAVSIDSGEFHIVFSEEIAGRIFESVRNEPQILKQIKKEPKLYVPMLAVPENNKNLKKDDKTTIEISINPDKSKDEYCVQKQIDELDLRILLFLPNTSKIEIKTEGKNIVYERFKVGSSPSEVLLKKKENGEIVAKEEFLLFEKKKENFAKVDNDDKDVGLAFAVPKSMDGIKNAHLYSFFPILKTSSPFRCLFHATYELDDQRNNLQVNQINYDIIKEQFRFLFSDVVNYFIKQNDYKTLYEIIVPKLENDYLFQQPFRNFDKLGIENCYLDFFGKAKIFKTVNGTLVSLEDKPKIIEGDYPKEFKGSGFDSLIEPIENQNLLKLIKIYSTKFKIKLEISEFELLEIINEQSGRWDVPDQVSIFIWWNERNYSLLPNLLKDKENNWLKCRQDCYFLVGDIDEDIIPKWSKIPALNTRYQKELLRQAELLPQVSAKVNGAEKQQIHRVISQNSIFPCLTFHYIDKNTVIGSVNSTVDSYESAVLFIKWLWENFNNDGWQPPDGVSYHFPAINLGNKKMDSPQNICFGNAYGNHLAQMLFDDSFGSLPNASEFDVKPDSIDNFVNFVKKFGVTFFPVIRKSVFFTVIKGFDNYYQEQVRKKEGLKLGEDVWCKYEMPFINQLEKILKDIDTSDVIEWINKDHNLFAYTSNSLYNESEANVQYKYGQKKNFRDLKCIVRNYILEIFNTTPWLQIWGNRYSPRQVLKGINTRNNPKFSGLLPIVDSEYISKIAEQLNLKYDVVSEIFNKFDMSEDPTELPSNQFYGLMLKIPTLNFNEAEKLSRIIYGIVEQSDFNQKYEDSDCYKEYKKSGKLLVKYKGTLQFYDAREAFLPSSKIVNTNDLPIVVKGQRTNNENFKRLFGCKEYDKSYELKKIEFADCDNKFQEYFKEFKKYAQAYSNRNNKIAEHGSKLTIQLASRVEILIGEENSTIEEEYAPVRKTVSCWYVTCFGEDFDKKKLSIAIENIYENIANTQFDAGKIGELFRESDKSGREFLIEKEFGSLDVIDDESYESEIRNNFIATVKKIDDAYDVSVIQIDFEHFESELSIKSVIDLLNELKIDVDQFQKAGFAYTINLVPYYKAVLKKTIRDESRNFKNYLFTKNKRDNYSELTVDDLKNKFLAELRQFENYNISDIPNSISFDVKKEVKKRFGDWDGDADVLDADKEYSKNFEEMNPEKKFQDEISLNENIQTMIYFHKNEEFKKWLKMKEAELSQAENDKGNDIYAELRGVIPTETPIDYREGPLFRETDRVKPRHGVFTNSGKAKRERNQKIAGNKGELLAYNLLCEKYGKKNVFPMSEAYVELGIIDPGQEKNCGYDIAYKDSKGNVFHVEVKTGESQTFTISSDELKYAMDNAEVYKLFYVYNLEKDPPDYHELPQKFWEDSRYQKRDIIEKIEFRF